MKKRQSVEIMSILTTILFMYCLVLPNISFSDDQSSHIKSSGANTSDSTYVVDFENDLIPIFTKFGCNAGACHGSAAGRGELNLSLFGGNPQADYQAIVRQFSGRRINLIYPDESLVILKPTAQTKHGGGQVLNENEEAVKLLLNWIKQGARFNTQRELERVEISPKKQIIQDLETSIQLRSIAHFSNGTTKDVTRWTVFSPEDTSAIRIGTTTSTAKMLRTGRHIILARYLTEVIPIEFISPLNTTPIDNTNLNRASSQDGNTVIDGEILKLLATLRIPVSETADDAIFLRRVTLDLTGRLPVPDHVTAFLADKDPTKRETLVDSLLQSEEFNQYWTLQLAKLIRIGGQNGNSQGTLVYHRWLEQQIQDGVGYDQIARSIIMAEGDSHQVGPANFYRTTKSAGEQAEFMSELFMGARLRCANCHNHPLDKWTQDDYHGLTAILAKVDGNDQVVKVKPQTEVIHPATRETAIPRIPGDRYLTSDIDGRAELVDWLTSVDNPYFARAIVNRLWKAMMGRGLVEPVDDFRSTNPATHPELLADLANDFIMNGYDLRHTLKRIVMSDAYGRSTYTLPENVNDDRFYSHALKKPLPPEVLADAISDVLNVPDLYGDEPEGTRAVALIAPDTESEALDILGRCVRQSSCETANASTDGLKRKLHLFNGEILNARIGVIGGRLDKLIESDKLPMEIIDAFYLAALSRHPTETERVFWKQHIDVYASAASQQRVLEDMVWSLLTCNEFVMNH